MHCKKMFKIAWFKFAFLHECCACLSVISADLFDKQQIINLSDYFPNVYEETNHFSQLMREMRQPFKGIFVRGHLIKHLAKR